MVLRSTVKTNPTLKRHTTTAAAVNSGTSGTTDASYSSPSRRTPPSMRARPIPPPLPVAFSLPLFPLSFLLPYFPFSLPLILPSVHPPLPLSLPPSVPLFLSSSPSLLFPFLLPCFTVSSSPVHPPSVCSSLVHLFFLCYLTFSLFARTIIGRTNVFYNGADGRRCHRCRLFYLWNDGTQNMSP